ncbi:MAG TPA: hypothetical protein EYG31_05405 [Porticoccaceae bacterium]|jgi:hypothetical protein|nr:hypothetical protein [Porticoccaceae bacterium]
MFEISVIVLLVIGLALQINVGIGEAAKPEFLRKEFDLVQANVGGVLIEKLEQMEDRLDSLFS